MTRWTFLRHAQSVANAGRFLSGWHDVPLTPTGQVQADAAGGLLADLEHDHGAPLFTRVVSSDLVRARVTAERAVAHWAAQTGHMAPAVTAHRALRERHLGDWQGRSLDALRASGKNHALLTWDQAPPGGESLNVLMARVLPFLATLDDGTPTLVVAHGGVLRAVLGLVDDLDRGVAARTKVPNAQPVVRVLATGTLAQLAKNLPPPG